VTDMSEVFSKIAVPGADKFNGDISKWDVSSVTTMYRMFYTASSFKGDLSKWDVSSVTNMQDIFAGPSSFNGDLSKWDVSSVTNMAGMFHGPSSFNGDISKWDVSGATNMRYMFYASSFKGDLSKWDVSKVTTMEGMFQSAKSFNGDLSKWDVSRVTNMLRMFNGAKAFSQTICGAWQKSSAQKDGMFQNSAGGKMCVCPSGFAQVGAVGADIGGCGLESCNARKKFDTIAACAKTCADNAACKAFSWLDGKAEHDARVCTLYPGATANAKFWTSILCRKQ